MSSRNIYPHDLVAFFLSPRAKRRVSGEVQPPAEVADDTAIGDELLQVKLLSGRVVQVARAQIQLVHGSKLDKLRRQIACVRVAARARTSLPAPAFPEAQRVVRLDGGPRPVEAEARPWRSHEYRAHVRTFPCANPLCPEPELPREAHHAGEHGVGEKASDASCVPLTHGCHLAVTDTYCLPGLTQAETERAIWRAQTRIMNAYQQRQEARFAGVPVLRLVAALLLAALLGTLAACSPCPRGASVGAHAGRWS